MMVKHLKKDHEWMIVDTCLSPDGSFSCTLTQKPIQKIINMEMVIKAFDGLVEVSDDKDFSRGVIARAMHINFHNEINHFGYNGRRFKYCRVIVDQLFECSGELEIEGVRLQYIHTVNNRHRIYRVLGVQESYFYDWEKSE